MTNVTPPKRANRLSAKRLRELIASLSVEIAHTAHSGRPIDLKLIRSLQHITETVRQIEGDRW